MSGKGFITIAGAGPLDASLVTLAAHRKICEADVILYDRLIDPEILRNAKKDAVLIDVGKRAKDFLQRTREQEEIHELMLKYFKEGKHVLRLQGGDPVFFGRLADECEFLSAHGADYEVIPGISSFSAASALAGIPLTHRDHSRSVAIATGHLKEGDNPDSIKIPKADTLIFLMALKNLPLLVQKILDEGLSGDTPAALIQNVASSDQKVHSGRLSDICAIRDKFGVVPPALLIVGEVVKFHEKYSALNKKPLFGKSVLWTSPSQDETFYALKESGAKVHPCPMIEIVPLSVSESVFQAPLADTYTDIIFTTRNSVEYFIQALKKSGKDVRQLFNVRILAVGPTTVRALEKHGLAADTQASKYHQEGLLEILDKDLSKRTFLFPSAKDARKVLGAEIQKRGGAFREMVLYETRMPADAKLPEGKIDGVIFMSSSAVHNLCRLTDRYSEVTVFAIGPQTALALKEKGFKDIIAAEEYYGKALIDRVKQHWRKP